MVESLRPDQPDATPPPDIFTDYPHLAPVLGALGLPTNAIIDPTGILHYDVLPPELVEDVMSLACSVPELGPDGVRKTLGELRAAIAEPNIQARLDQIAPLSPLPDLSNRAKRRWFTSFDDEIINHWETRSNDAAGKRPSTPDDRRLRMVG